MKAESISTPRIVACPRCGAPVPWAPQSRWRPFCSERCKLIDLGDWATERYRIPGVESPDPGDDGGDTPPPLRDD
ncbi:MAG: DNA gyrase inhibitor YacG [Burkholderiales bacterium]|nr:DNA gyrase inhibitor YacG [Burkholderiales bacterium]